VHSSVGSAFRKRAIPFRWANSNPARDVQPPAILHHEITPPTNEEVIALIKGAPESFRAFVRLSANSGMRRSEVLALQWGDVDLDAGRIVVRRSIIHTPASGIVIGLTKTGTKGYRVISVGASVVDELKVHKAVQEAAAKSNTLPAPVWVFSHDAGVSPWRPRTPPIPLRRRGRWNAVSNWMVESAEASLTALAGAPRCRIEKRNAQHRMVRSDLPTTTGRPQTRVRTAYFG
jgi:integrase